MSKTAPKAPAAETAVRKSHLIIAPQSAGRIGKSTAAEAIITWAKFAGVEFAALDLDAEHKTLSQRFPEQSTAFPEAAESDDGFMELLTAVCEAPAPLIVADFPAQATDHILYQLSGRGGLNLLDAAGIGVTCLIFPADDTAARQSAVKCVSTLGERVQWLVVRQPGPKALIEAEDWSESGIGRKLAEFGAGELDWPRLSSSTRDAYEEACKTAGRWLSLEDARKKVSFANEFEIDFWRNRVLVTCEDHAGFLIPDESLIRTRTTRAGEPAPSAKPPTGGLGLDL